MNGNISQQTISSDPVVLLNQMLLLLENERQALLSGNASAVFTISQEKETVIAAIKDCSSRIKADSSINSEVRMLSETVALAANSNHNLLFQMYEHYKGMYEFLLKISGHGATYGRDGSLTRDYETKPSADITV